MLRISLCSLYLATGQWSVTEQNILPHCVLYRAEYLTVSVFNVVSCILQSISLPPCAAAKGRLPIQLAIKKKIQRGDCFKCNSKLHFEVKFPNPVVVSAGEPDKTFAICQSKLSFGAKKMRSASKNWALLQNCALV